MGQALPEKSVEEVSHGVKDVDFGYLHIAVRNAKGGRDRITMLPVSLVEPLRREMEKRRLMHEEDLAAGAGLVYLPHALARKYPRAARELMRPNPLR